MTTWRVKIDAVLDLPLPTISLVVDRINAALAALGDIGGAKVSVAVPQDRWRAERRAERDQAALAVARDAKRFRKLR